MTLNRKASLKSLNLKWLVGLAIFDVVVIGLLFGPSLVTIDWLSSIVLSRVIAAFVIPVAVVLVVNVLPHNVKGSMVYWRPLGVVPGTEVFTKHAPRDPRINMGRLAQLFSPLPTEPRAQNALWYEVFKQVEGEPEVDDAHRHFLLYRDMAVLSVALMPAAPVVLYLSGQSAANQWLAALALLMQYFLAALSAPWSGVRFVCNVLAVYAVRPRQVK